MDQQEEKSSDDSNADAGAKREALQKQRENLFVDKIKPSKPNTLGQNGRELIQDWEKLKLYAHIPKKGDKWTIGFGHTHGVKEGDTITKEQAFKYFEADSKSAAQTVNKNVHVPLTQNQYDALVMFTYNVGAGNFKDSTLLKKLNKGEYTEVAGEMRKWNKSPNEKGIREFTQGLANRREAEIKLFNRRD